MNDRPRASISGSESVIAQPSMGGRPLSRPSQARRRSSYSGVEPAAGLVGTKTWARAQIASSFSKFAAVRSIAFSRSFSSTDSRPHRYRLCWSRHGRRAADWFSNMVEAVWRLNIPGCEDVGQSAQEHVYLLLHEAGPLPAEVFELAMCG
jgi:hypothetical protein